ncbi:integrase, catalytic region, zinc finger, CCHC-type containing protein [Tanacetum coccineum]
MSTSKTYQQSLAEAGSETRPSMLERGSYIPWASRFKRFLNLNWRKSEVLLKALGTRESLDDVHNHSKDPLASAMLLLAKAITQNFSNPTNNRLRASSNTRNQAVVQGDRVNIQSRNSGNVGRNNRRAYVQEEVVEGMNATNETANVQRIVRTPTPTGNTSTGQCYNCGGKGHYAKELPKPRDEAGVILTDEQNDFLFADASRMEEIEELRVQSSSINENDEQMYPTHTKIINSTIDDDQINSNIQFDSVKGNVNSGSVEKDTHVYDLCALETLARNAYDEAAKQQRYASKEVPYNKIYNLTRSDSDERAKRVQKQVESQLYRYRDIIRYLEKQRDKLWQEVVQIVLWVVDSGCSKHMTGDRSLLRNFVEKFMGTVRFGNDNFAAITGYGDYIHGNITICHVYYVEGLGHNLFSVGQFCDGDLEVVFHSNTCYVQNLEGDDLLTGGNDSNLYTISISDMAASSPICLMFKATLTKSWLWHRRLSHLNFGTINDLTKLDLVDGLPKFKYEKDHLCSACERGKSKKASHPPKLIPSDYSKLELLHMDLCDPMRVASVNGKKYILVIVDDFSRFTWVYFLRSKDETPEIIKKFIAQAQLNYKAKVCKIQCNVVYVYIYALSLRCVVLEDFVVYYDASNQGFGMCAPAKRQGDYVCIAAIKDSREEPYHARFRVGCSSKVNVVADALSRKERVKLKRVRAMSMTIQSSLKEKLLATQRGDQRRECASRNVEWLGSANGKEGR